MRILMVMAHPDDEVIFGWPILQDRKGNNISLLTLSDNASKHGAGPINALKEVCKRAGIQLLDFPRKDNNFYRTEPRFEKYILKDVINLFQSNVRKAIDIAKPEIIFTHNPMGEYGHGDHRFVFNLISMFNINLMFTDICFANGCHLSSGKVPGIYLKHFFGKLVGQHHILNLSWYNRMKRIYERHGAWSWSGHPPITDCKLYSFM